MRHGIKEEEWLGWWLRAPKRGAHGPSFKTCLGARTRFGRDVFLISMIVVVVCGKTLIWCDSLWVEDSQEDISLASELSARDLDDVGLSLFLKLPFAFTIHCT